MNCMLGHFDLFERVTQFDVLTFYIIFCSNRSNIFCFYAIRNSRFFGVFRVFPLRWWRRNTTLNALYARLPLLVYDFLSKLFDEVKVDGVRLGLVECVTDRCRKEGMLLLKRADRPLDRTLRPKRKLIAPLPDRVINPAATVLVTESNLAGHPIPYLLEKDRLIQAELYGKARKDGKRGF